MSARTFLYPGLRVRHKDSRWARVELIVDDWKFVVEVDGVEETWELSDVDQTAD